MAHSTTHEAALITALPRVATQVREPNEKLWALLTKPGALTAAEWAYIDEQERRHEVS